MTVTTQTVDRNVAAIAKALQLLDSSFSPETRASALIALGRLEIWAKANCEKGASA